jgi:hypothetical protein
LFSTKTGYYALDDRIEKTKAKKEELLKVLKYPELAATQQWLGVGSEGGKTQARCELADQDGGGHKS